MSSQSPSPPLSPAMMALPQSHTPELAASTALDLPHELLSTVVSLAQPKPIVPMASSILKSICIEGRLIHVAWRNCLLLRPAMEIKHSRTAHNFNLRRVLQFLFNATHLENGTCAKTSFAPTKPRRSDPIFTSEFVDWLYCSPFAKPLAIGKQSSGPFTFRWWHYPNDQFVLPVYFIRTGHLDLLESCLLHQKYAEFVLAWPSWKCLAFISPPRTFNLFEELSWPLPPQGTDFCKLPGHICTG
ncbi:hypothetical protein BCR44DRAFT_79749 [Catenaria anguillulae PL171]|uniref:Uncharacterized protein n=1 Tax=Catenaria anguillulae PL171 TaxID=765915 RepID=A0A1Y2I4T1_9FUNG|nr:hypothetical protein BCR44DRAFT_79749 [Catenaria anguillulae PL171]